jgi:uncharacterized membrane protein
VRWPKARSRHWNFYLAGGAGVIASIITLAGSPKLFPAVAVSVFSLVYLLLTARDMPRLTPDYLRDHAADEDAPPLVVFLLTVAIVIYAIVSLFMAVNAETPDVLLLSLGGASVVLSWFMIHTMWGMHYAWEYYAAADKPTKGRREKGGLEFPGDDDPDGTDFVYYAMVVAMTDQTSDTDVTSRAMRRITTGHSLFSYFFNTVIVAASINIVVSLTQQG